MKKLIIPTVLLCVFQILMSCGSSDEMGNAEIRDALEKQSLAFNTHDLNSYAETLSDDFVSDWTSVPQKSGRDDFLSLIRNLMEGETVHYQVQKLYSKSHAVFFDECSTVSIHPETGKQYRVFHSDIVEFENDTRMTKMITYHDGYIGSVALGLIEPTLPRPPLPIQSLWIEEEPEPTGMAPVETHREVMQRWNSHDVRNLALLFDTSSEILPSQMFDYIGRESYMSWLEIMFEAFPDLNIKENRMLELEDNYVMTEIELSGTNTGYYLGNEPTGKSFSQRAALLGKYSDEGIVLCLKMYFDSQVIMNQLGIEPVAIPTLEL